jgi:hypothetical protein
MEVPPSDDPWLTKCRSAAIPSGRAAAGKQANAGIYDSSHSDRQAQRQTEPKEAFMQKGHSRLCAFFQGF